MTLKNTRLCAPRSPLRILVDFVGAGSMVLGLIALVLPRVELGPHGFDVRCAFAVLWFMFCGSTVGLAFLSSGQLSVTVAGVLVVSFIFVAGFSPSHGLTFLHLAIEIVAYGLGVLLPFRMQATDGASRRGALRFVSLPALVLGIAVALFLWRYQTPMETNPPIFAPSSPVEESTLPDAHVGREGAC